MGDNLGDSEPLDHFAPRVQTIAAVIHKPMSDAVKSIAADGCGITKEGLSQAYV